MESSSVTVKVEGSPHSHLEHCSICLDPVGLDAQERSVAKLKCGHIFHLDCIGSSHNSKGIMQCPNCRDIEDGDWYYASGNIDPEDIGFDDAFHEEELIVDINPYIGVYGTHQHFNSLGWCPYDGSYPHMPVPVGELEIAAGDYPGTLVAFVCENVSSACPFVPVNESRSSRHPTGYDSMVGAFRHMQSDSVGGEVARHGIRRPDADATRRLYMQLEPRDADAIRLCDADAIGRLYTQLEPLDADAMSSHDADAFWCPPIPFVDDGVRRAMPHHERPVPYRVASDLVVTQGHMDVASPLTVWTEPNAPGHVLRGPGPLLSPGPILSGLGTSSSSRYRGIGGAGRTEQMNESHGRFRVGGAPSSGGQDTGIASMPGTNWQGDQGIPWRRDGYSDFPWAALEPEPWRRSSPASSGSNTSSYQGANRLRNGALRTASGFPGYPSTFQPDGTRVIGSVIPQSTRRPR